MTPDQEQSLNATEAHWRNELKRLNAFEELSPYDQVYLDFVEGQLATLLEKQRQITVLAQEFEYERMNLFLPLLEEMILASSSPDRASAVRHLYNLLFSLVHAIAPEEDAGLKESSTKRPWETAWEKVIAILHFLKVIHEIPEELNIELVSLKKVTLQFLRELGLSLKTPFWVYASDVLTQIAANLEDLDTAPELLKLDRLTKDTTLTERQAILDEDKKEMQELFTHEGGFWVKWTIGNALLHTLVQNGKRIFDVKNVSELEVRAKLPSLTQQEVDDAYANPKVDRIGPRVDVADLVDRAQIIQMRDTSDEESPWAPVSDDLARLLVVGGILPEQLMREMMIGTSGVSGDVEDPTRVPLIEHSYVYALRIEKASTVDTAIPKAV